MQRPEKENAMNFQKCDAFNSIRVERWKKIIAVRHNQNVEVRPRLHASETLSTIHPMREQKTVVQEVCTQKTVQLNQKRMITQ
jgi:hypothetical protein